MDEGIRNLTETICRVKSQLDHAKGLRRQRSTDLVQEELKLVDNVLTSTEEALNEIARLIEPAEVNMVVSGAEVHLSARMHCEFRSLDHIPVKLSRLDIAGSNLKMALSILSPRRSSSARTSTDLLPPPTYQESEWLFAGRQKILRRRASAMAVEVSGGSYAESTSTSPAIIPQVKLNSMPVPGLIEREDGEAQAEPLDSFKIALRSDWPAAGSTKQDKVGRLSGKTRSQSWLDYHAQSR
ncbi:hypothetical protein Tdes44962_MAKER08489 [Teratosphaeria destructans]|uniref:Uncharacterized protein n=1 Tax=Teratosphaeria destructans TaxID=418781 RepID=A0A9W7SWM7_9PEZI|nr:hypothetical protein Tdes44962_MAKER08489 [Teratosphaeria destructans]